MLLCLLPWLTSCSHNGPVRTETVEVKVPVLVTLDPALTTREPEPAPPARRCKDAAGRATVCNGVLAEAIDALRAWGRRGWARVDAIRALQPTPPTEEPPP